MGTFCCASDPVKTADQMQAARGDIKLRKRKKHYLPMYTIAFFTSMSGYGSTVEASFASPTQVIKRQASQI
jgi:hypothetical protein